MGNRVHKQFESVLIQDPVWSLDTVGRRGMSWEVIASFRMCFPSMWYAQCLIPAQPQCVSVVKLQYLGSRQRQPVGSYKGQLLGSKIGRCHALVFNKWTSWFLVLSLGVNQKGREPVQPSWETGSTNNLNQFWYRILFEAPWRRVHFRENVIVRVFDQGAVVWFDQLLPGCPIGHGRSPQNVMGSYCIT